MTRPDALLIDLGNVLTFFSHERMLQQMAAVCGVHADRLRAEFFDGGVFAAFERGELTPADVRNWCASAFDAPDITTEQLRVATSDMFVANAPMKALLDSVRATAPDVRFVAITNTCAWHLDWVRTTYDVLDGFDAVVTSYLVGALKPDPPMYLEAIEAAGVPATRCFYTDDIVGYVEAGRSHGLDAEVFIDPDSCRSHLRARGFAV